MATPNISDLVVWSDHPTNPLTRTPLATTDLVADKVLQTRIDEFVASALSTTLSICRM